MIVKLEFIPEGEKGWKLNRLDHAIIMVMKRATQPNCGWRVHKKLPGNIFRKYNGKEVHKRMAQLHRKGFLSIDRYGPDGDAEYSIRYCVEINGGDCEN